MNNINDETALRSPQNNKPSQENTPPKPWLLRAFIPLAVFALALSLYAIFLNHQSREQDKQLSLALNQIQENQRANRSQIDSAIDHLQREKNTLKTHLERLEKTLQANIQQYQYQTLDWLLLKARYYLELADANTLWTQDIETTVKLFQEADHLLAPIHDQRLLPIRNALAQDITLYTQLPKVDRSGLLGRLDALQTALLQLPVKPLIKPDSPSPSLSNKGNSWKEAFKASLLRLKQLVVIQHRDDQSQPLYTRAYESLIRETAYLNLQEAQWAILKQDQKIYRLSIHQAVENIQRVFDVNSSQTQSMLQQLYQLQVNIIQPKPTPGHALSLLNQLIDSKAKPSSLTTPDANNTPGQSI